METVESLVKKYKKMGTSQIVSQMGRVTGNSKLACLEILKGRNQDTSKWEDAPVNIPVESPKELKTMKGVYEAEPESELTPEEKKAIKQALKEREEDENSIKLRVEKETIKATGKKTSTPKKPKEEVTSLVEESQVYPDGSLVIFTDKTGEHVGEVKRFVWDKQDKMYYYVLKMENKKITYKRPKNILRYAE
jgi:hypothetical protein